MLWLQSLDGWSSPGPRCAVVVLGPECSWDAGMVQSEINKCPSQTWGCSLSPGPPEQTVGTNRPHLPRTGGLPAVPAGPAVPTLGKSRALWEHTPSHLPLWALSLHSTHSGYSMSSSPSRPRGTSVPGVGMRVSCRLWGPSLELNTGSLTSWVTLGKLLSLSVPRFVCKMRNLKRLLDR